MARRQITQELYESLCIAFKDKPGNCSNAARVAGCDRRMAKRAWEKGWKYAPWAIPIKVALQRDQVEARAVRAQIRTREYLDAEQIRDQARQDAIESRAEEGELVRLARRATIDLMGQTVLTIEAARAVTQRLHQAVTTGGVDSLSPGQCLSLMEKLAKTSASAVSTGQAVMRMERLHMGQPETIVGVDMGGLTDQDISSELREIQTALQSLDAGDSEVIEAAVIEVGGS